MTYALQYIPLDELRRLRALELEPVERTALLADACRLNTLYMVMRAGSGHIGTSFSAMDIITWLHLYELQEQPVGAEPARPERIYFSSKGHDAPGFYSLLVALEVIDFELIHQLRRLGGLAGHPDVQTMPAVHTNTGSLGMGVAKAKGFARARRAAGKRAEIFVLFGDGELQEGQFWESLQPAANGAFGEIVGIVDANKIQSDTWVADVSDLGRLADRIAAHGWAVDTVDGHDLAAFSTALDRLRAENPDRPKLLIADTIKGKGVVEFEPGDLQHGGSSLYEFHSGAPASEVYVRANEELRGRIDERLQRAGAKPIRLEHVEPLRRSAPASPQRLVPAYGAELAALAAVHPELVALDADLVLDTGLLQFREAHPDRFFECGIAEQDMVSQAGALALAGMLPTVHSFACFLAARPNEQIYNNASERTKIIYAGSLAGLLPGGPGHSHQSVRDISALSGIPGLTLVEPATESEARALLRWAVEQNPGSTYIRLVSIPVDVPFEPSGELPPLGQGRVVRAGADVALIGYGPVMLSQVWTAAEALSAGGVEAAVIDLPWLRQVDGSWLTSIAADARLLVTLDNHYLDGGQGDAVAAALVDAGSQLATRMLRLGVLDLPVCGANDEVLAAHRLDAESIAAQVLQRLG